MLQKNYYFLKTVLPSLQIGAKPEIPFYELMTLFSMNLAREDWKKITGLRLLTDIRNVYALLTKEAVDSRGNFSQKELEEALANEVALPQFLFDFFEEYESLEQRIHFFSKVYVKFFQHWQDESKGFLQQLFVFERKLSLVLTAKRSKYQGRDLTKELQFEDQDDFFVQELLAGKDLPDFVFPAEFSDLETILSMESKDPVKEYQFIAKYRFNKIDEMIRDDQFTIDWLLAYAAKLLTVEDWWNLDEDDGNLIFNQIVKEIA